MTLELPPQWEHVTEPLPTDGVVLPQERAYRRCARNALPTGVTSADREFNTPRYCCLAACRAAR